jgi:glycosyltransferase involved in cell wall biosynthesis
MISIVYCTREENKKHTDHLLKACGNPKVEIIEYINKGESLTKFYNKALAETKNDIVVFAHDDIIVETKQIANRIVRMFENNPEYGIIGVAGTKYLSNTGRWWDERKSMYGKVAHTHEGKTWLSEYSPDQDKRLEETIIVDGVFFAVNKNRIKQNFDEAVEGFHFYDVDFSFRNHLEGVKVGVTTEIRINHMSIGMTNEQWESNRVQFADKFKDELPVRLNETFQNRRLRILMGCLNFEGLTGSEISTLETAKGLASRNCDVSVVSLNIGDEFKKICNKHGIKTYSLNEPPHYKLGDGKWLINAQNGPQPSQPNMLYRVNQQTFDIIHANHKPITERLLQLYPESNFVNIVRSEVIDLENPIVDDKIKKYIAIRPSIKDYVVNNFGISEDMVEVVYNPFDKSRFKPNSLPSGTDKPVVLFVGTMDYLREKPIMDLVEKCRTENKELWLVGKDTMGYASNLGNNEPHVKYFEPTDKIEEFYYKCDVTAGIMLGRTTIEGFLCGKPAIIYNVDKTGEITGVSHHEVPEDLSIFDFDNIIDKIKSVYIESYNK